MMPPNQRLKLAGALAGRIAFPRWPAFVFCGSTALRQRALRPQLKRDPLGGALPFHKRSFVTDCLYGECPGRRAPRRASVHMFTAPHHSNSATCRARCARPPISAAAQKQRPKARRPDLLVGRAARSSIGATRAV